MDSWDFRDSIGFSRDSFGFLGFCWDFSRFFEIFMDSWDSSGIHWRFFGILRDSSRFFGDSLRI